MIYLAILLFVILGLYFFLRQPQFGKAPSGNRQSRIASSPNFRKGSFQNISKTPALAEGTSYASMMKDYFFGKDERVNPATEIPGVKTDLMSLDPNEDLLVWFGHSSYYMQINGKRFLVDPVLSGFASPIPYTVRAFRGTQLYAAADLPEIDYLLITHDHYDHLDHQTIKRIKNKVKNVITGLGTGAHLEHWGYEASVITEMDWHEENELEHNIKIVSVPARHFSGRAFKRNNTLWTSFVLYAGEHRLFLGGDSGYDAHFKQIGDAYGPFSLAILENGQYHNNWKYIHMMPEEAVDAALDLRASRLLPVHWSRFSLSLHAWDDSIRRILKEAQKKEVPVIHPMIGEVVPLKGELPVFLPWWENHR